MIKGIRILVRDKQLFTEQNGILHCVEDTKPCFLKFPKNTKFLHIVDLNGKKGNATNFDIYDKLTQSINIEVEISQNELLIKKLIKLKARAVLDLPVKIDLKKFKDNKKLLVGKIIIVKNIRNDDIHDYYIETNNLKTVKKLGKGKRIFLYSNIVDEKQAEKAGVFALIRDL